jgi:hypothetical protein
MARTYSVSKSNIKKKRRSHFPLVQFILLPFIAAVLALGIIAVQNPQVLFSDAASTKKNMKLATPTPKRIGSAVKVQKSPTPSPTKRPTPTKKPSPTPSASSLVITNAFADGVIGHATVVIPNINIFEAGTNKPIKDGSYYISAFPECDKNPSISVALGSSIPLTEVNLVSKDQVSIQTRKSGNGVQFFVISNQKEYDMFTLPDTYSGYTLQYTSSTVPLFKDFIGCFKTN